MPRLVWRWFAPAAALVLILCGCTGPCQYVANHFKVGPNYKTPPAPVADHWIDINDKRIIPECDDLAAWWTVLNDPLLDHLMQTAYQQNLTLREAGNRILEARARYGIALGDFLPQEQDMRGSYTRSGIGRTNFFDRWNTSFNLAWELDFWGRFRRAIISADDALDASSFDYDQVLVTLLGDVATNYVVIRTDQERIRLLERVIKIQQDVYSFIDQRLKFGFKGITDLDRAQAESNLKQSQAQLAQFRIDIRTAENRLCVLLGMPVINIESLLNTAPNTDIPTAPDYLVVGIPADLLRRRPDVRRQERLAAAQCEQIGIAESDMYPAFTISGTLGWQAATFSGLFSPDAFNSNISPHFQWNLLNYGRFLNNRRRQQASFWELVATYQETVLEADEEVEDGIITYLQSQDRARLLKESVDAANIALTVQIQQYENSVQALGPVDFNRYALIVQNLITQQDLWAQARGQIDLGLIQVYRSLGGGWQIRLGPPPADGVIFLPPTGAQGAQPEVVGKPGPETLPAPPINLKPVPPQQAPQQEIPAPQGLKQPAGSRL